MNLITTFSGLLHPLFGLNVVDALASTALTARDAGTIPNASQFGGRVIEAVGYISPTAAAEATSVYRFCEVPSGARVTYLRLSAADFSTAGVIHIGVHRCTADGGAVVDADFFASSVDMAASSGIGTDTNLLNESTTNTLAKQEQPLWQALGVAAWTSDPAVSLDITATVATQFNGGQAMLMRVGYVL